MTCFSTRENRKALGQIRRVAHMELAVSPAWRGIGGTTTARAAAAMAGGHLAVSGRCASWWWLKNSMGRHQINVFQLATVFNGLRNGCWVKEVQNILKVIWWNEKLIVLPSHCFLVSKRKNSVAYSSTIWFRFPCCKFWRPWSIPDYKEGNHTSYVSLILFMTWYFLSQLVSEKSWVVATKLQCDLENG